MAPLAGIVLVVLKDILKSFTLDRLSLPLLKTYDMVAFRELGMICTPINYVRHVYARVVF